MKAKLVVVGGTTSTTEVSLKLPAIIGRGRSAQVTIPHSLVSRQHCELSNVEGRLVVRDLDSLNGTYVGDERITEAILAPGALLTVGTVTFRAIYDVGCGDSHSADGDDTCLDTDTVNGEQSQIADHETVPVDSGAFRKPRSLSTASDVSDEKGSEAMSEPSGQPSLESAAQNSD
jgi:pSer/pThr/pTyr-binding forkhead associated (FHA) protein